MYGDCADTGGWLVAVLAAPTFTIHDREDSADLMNLVRHERGLSKTESRFPTKGTCLAIYSRCINAELAIEEVVGMTFPWCSTWAAELKELFAAYVDAKQRQNVLDYDHTSARRRNRSCAGCRGPQR